MSNLHPRSRMRYYNNLFHFQKNKLSMHPVSCAIEKDLLQMESLAYDYIDEESKKYTGISYEEEIKLLEMEIFIEETIKNCECKRKDYIFDANQECSHKLFMRLAYADLQLEENDSFENDQATEYQPISNQEVNNNPINNQKENPYVTYKDMTFFSKNAYDYKCSVPHCNKRFSCKYGLDYHSKHVHNQPISSEKKYICLFQYCEKRLTTYNGLIYHLKTAHGLQRGEFSKFFYVALN